MEALQWLLAKGADASLPNAEGSSPLHAAAANGQAACVTFLVANGADGEFTSCIVLVQRTQGSSMI